MKSLIIDEDEDEDEDKDFYQMGAKMEGLRRRPFCALGTEEREVRVGLYEKVVPLCRMWVAARKGCPPGPKGEDSPRKAFNGGLIDQSWPRSTDGGKSGEDDAVECVGGWTAMAWVVDDLTDLIR